MSTVLKAHKQSNARLLIALAVSAVIAMAVAFYLTSTGKADAAEQEAPAAAAATVEAPAATVEAAPAATVEAAPVEAPATAH
jgi:hypothetical protein